MGKKCFHRTAAKTMLTNNIEAPGNPNWKRMPTLLTCHMPHVIYHKSHVISHMSHATCVRIEKNMFGSHISGTGAENKPGQHRCLISWYNILRMMTRKVMMQNGNSLFQIFIKLQNRAILHNCTTTLMLDDEDSNQ